MLAVRMAGYSWWDAYGYLVMGGIVFLIWIAVIVYSNWDELNGRERKERPGHPSDLGGGGDV